MNDDSAAFITGFLLFICISKNSSLKKMCYKKVTTYINLLNKDNMKEAINAYHQMTLNEKIATSVLAEEEMHREDNIDTK